MHIVIEMEDTEAAETALDQHDELEVWGESLNEMVHVKGAISSHAMKDGGVKVKFEDDFFTVGGEGVQAEIISSTLGSDE
jgi:hypothetical protein